MHYNELISNHFRQLNTPQEGEGESELDLSPFYSCKYKQEPDLIRWLSRKLSTLQQEAGPRTENQFRNIRFFKGIHSLKNDAEVLAVDYDNQPVTMENRFVMNHILEFTLQKVADLTRYSPNINVFPWSNAYASRLSARLGKKIIDSSFYTHNFRDHLMSLILEGVICGESFLFQEWDEFAGALDSDTAQKEARLSLLGKNFVNEEGETIDLSYAKYIGDHKFSRPLPFQVLFQPRVRWSDVDYLFKATIKHIDEVKAENAYLGQSVLDKISRKADAAEYRGSLFEGTSDHVVQWEFYHRRHRFVPKGFYAKFFNDVLIRYGKLPYSHGQLPCIRFTDYDDPVNAHGRSFYESLKLPSVMINNLTKIAYRSYAIAAYPKLIMQEGSCNMYAMANGPFVVEVTPGALEPKIVSFKALNNDFFTLSDHVENFMQKNSGTFGISRGEQVPNARARSILNFYEEQEDQRKGPQVAKLSACIEKAAKQNLSNSADFYKPEDKRTLRIVGKNNAYKLLEVTDKIKISGDDIVKVQRTTALSESKQGRVDQISTLSNIPFAGDEGPGLFTKEQVLSMIEVGDTSTFFESSTAAVERAHSENEDMFEGLEVNDPQPYQAHLIDWNIHFHWVQSREFSETTGVPEEIKERTLGHLEAHELFLYTKARTNLALAQILASNKYFPAVYRINDNDPPLSHIVLMLQQLPPPPTPLESPDGAGAGAAPLPPENAPDILEPDALPLADEQVPSDALPLADPTSLT